jgi:arabinose-5-phosphate isomerase
MTDTMTGLELARKVLRIEAAAILALVDRVNGDFERAVQLLFECKGRVIVTGMGKSGLICRKIAATFSSTGTSAWFLHPAEAIHGDLGAIRDDDVVLAVSYSGETEELIRLLESIRRIGARLIALTGDPSSTLARAADVTLDCGIRKEACPMNLVPTASTTAALAMGDALAMTLLVRKGFREEQFASLHPGGKLGRRLMRVEHLMHGHAHGGCVSRNVEQAPRHDVRRRRRPASRRGVHGRRPAPVVQPRAERHGADRRGGDDATTDHHRSRRPRG